MRANSDQQTDGLLKEQLRLEKVRFQQFVCALQETRLNLASNHLIDSAMLPRL